MDNSEASRKIRFIVGDFELNFGDAMVSEDGKASLYKESTAIDCWWVIQRISESGCLYFCLTV